MKDLTRSEIRTLNNDAQDTGCLSGVALCIMYEFVR
jgi:hypothetical protein